MTTAPNIKRFVDIVDRGPEDDLFYPASSNNTIFHREHRPYHNVVPEVVEIGYQGNAAWGQRITIALTRKDSGDLLQWICLRLQPRSWMGEHESKILNGWDYQDPSAAWMWASSLGTIAIQKVDFEIGDTLVESWPGEWMDVWSRAWMDGGRAAVWDSDIYGKLPPGTIRQLTRPPWTTVLPTEDGYVYCWLPLCMLRRPQTAFPLVAMGEQEVRVHVTLRPFNEVVRRRAVPRTNPCEVPLGETVVLLDTSGPTPVPWACTLPDVIPAIEDVTVLVGVVHTEDPLRSNYMRVPMEIMYEPVRYARFDLPDAITQPSGTPITMNFPLREFNGPIREICFFLRRKGVWQFNEWTNYGALGEAEVYSPLSFNTTTGQPAPQQPILVSAQLMVDNAVWRNETEQWWRIEYGLAHRGGVRLTGGFVYGFVLGEAAGWTAEDLQPAGTVNTSRASMRLDLTMQAPSPIAGIPYVSGWEVHVFGVGLNWMRFVKGLAVPLFQD